MKSFDEATIDEPVKIENRCRCETNNCNRLASIRLVYDIFDIDVCGKHAAPLLDNYRDLPEDAILINISLFID